MPATAADLAGLPLTTKQDLRDNYPFGMLAVPKARLATYHESSGTAGRPTPSYYTAEDWTDLAERPLPREQVAHATHAGGSAARVERLDFNVCGLAT